MKYSRDHLIARIEAGERLKYLHFWGHQPSSDGKINSACLSQWWLAPFEISGIRYLTAEHWMMAEKARTFHDENIRDQILQCNSPGEAKKLGREVENFDEELWNQQRFQIVVSGNYAKFSQNEALREFLVQTNTRVLVEASPVDAIWGNGLAANHELALNPSKWRGLNLLGFALMEVRDMLL